MPDRDVARPERTAVAVLAAWFMLVCLVLGAPLGLAWLIGWPLSGVRLPSGLPQDPWTLNTLTRCAVVAGWFLWAQFTACVVAEIRAAAGGARPAVHLPVAGPSRALARALVAVAFATAVSATALPAAMARPLAVASAGVTAGQNGSGAAAYAPADPARPVSGLSFDAGPGTARGAAAAVSRPADAATTQDAQTTAPMQLASDPSSVDSTLFADSGVKYYVVQPPSGRNHDSLWDIAQRYLGSGRRYREIYDLNHGRLQPDGSRLEQAGVIRPGWILALPADAEGPGLSTAPPTSSTAGVVNGSAGGSVNGSGTASSGGNGGSSGGYAVSSGTGSADSTSALLNGSGPAPAPVFGPPVARRAEPALRAPRPGTTNARPLGHPVASRPAVPQGHGHEAPADSDSVLHSIADALPYVGLIGSPVLAAALLSAVTAAGRRRRRDRPAGPRTAPPDPAVAEVERTIRAAALDDTFELLDRAMRLLQAHAERTGTPAPHATHARVTDDGLRLLLAASSVAAPPPWTVSPDARTWRISRTALARESAVAPAQDAVQDPQTAPPPGSPAAIRHPVPYPLLLCIGALGEDQILVNLDGANGRLTALTGPARQRRAVLAAAAATLACAPWADQLRIEAAGLPPELALLAPRRLRVHPDLPTALSVLEREGAGGAKPVRLLIAQDTAPSHHIRLHELTAGPGARAYALLGCERPLPDAPAFTVDHAGRLRIPELPGEITAARLPDPLAAALGTLLRSTSEPRLRTSPRPADLPPRHSLDQLARPAGVRACVLGPVVLTGVGPADGARGPLFTEALVLLLFHRAGLPAPVLARALWPRGITAAARDRMLRDMAAWLGPAPGGGPRLTVDAAGIVRLSDDVRSDWEEFQAAYRDAERIPAQLPQALESALVRALALVRGELLADRPAGRYTWLGFGTQETEVPTVVADVAHRLAVLRLERGDLAGAQWAAEQGLLGAPDDERLVRLRIQGIAAGGDRLRLDTAVADLKLRAWERHAETELDPQTEAVVAELVGGSSS